jgi:DNA-binding NtrC family response regulator
MNILLIEPDHELHAAMRTYLEDQDHRVTPCWSIAEAGEVMAGIACRSQAPDVIVSDTGGMTFYMKARQRFPGMRWILTARPLEVPQIDNPLTTAVASCISRRPAGDTLRPNELPTRQPPISIAQGG